MDFINNFQNLEAEKPKLNSETSLRGMVKDYDVERNIQLSDNNPNNVSPIVQIGEKRPSIKRFVESVLRPKPEEVQNEQNLSCSLAQLRSLMESRGDEAVTKLNNDYGGIDGLCTALNTDAVNGLAGDVSDLQSRRSKFGSNTIPPPKSRSFIRLFIDACKDPTLIILLISGFISFGLSFYKPVDAPTQTTNNALSAMNNFTYHKRNETFTLENILAPSINLTETGNTGVTKIPNADQTEDQSSAWIEGAAILISVLVVALVTAVNDYSKERQFRKLQEKVETGQTFSVIRGATAINIPVSELVVGDIARVKYGDLLPADGILIQGNDLKVDESSLTGESEHVCKEIDSDPMLLSGTYVMEGSGRMVVSAVGVNSQSGIIMTLLASGKMRNDSGYSDSSGGSSSRKSSVSSTSSSSSSSSSDSSASSNDGDRHFAKSVLQTKLSKLALQIIYCGTTVAVLALLILIIHFVIQHYVIDKQPFKVHDVHFFVKFFIIAVTILVISIPEGLPLAIALALTYSVRKMMHDNNLVRHLDACETMGNATCICSDKTGTLTTNRMTVVQSFVNGKYFKTSDSQPKKSMLVESTADLLAEAIVVNCAYNSLLIEATKEGEMVQQLGNKTECGLLGFVQNMGFNYLDIRKKFPEEDLFKVYTFNSSRKCMVTVIRLIEQGKDVGYRIYQKGASEIVLSRCTYFIDSNGLIKTFTEDDRSKIMEEIISEMAQNGLRTLCMGYKNLIRNSARISTAEETSFNQDDDINWDDEDFIFTNLIGIAICGIQDPVRPEVPEAIEKCRRAGITVRMVTGDNINTARAIAKTCGIVQDGDDCLVLEGKDFNEKVRDEGGRVCQGKIDEIWPRLRVLARAQPADKFTLVKGIIDSKTSSNREIVAVTGDGTNDGPALKKADVGFAMGIAGTDVAKEASDIILTDDNFTSIVKAITWGRNVYDSISKFLQFQLTVNVVAVLLSFISVCSISDSPLKAVHMLWMNLIMDTFASLALATEAATDELLKRKPYGRKKSLISRAMLRNILGHAIFQLVILLLLLYRGAELFGIKNGINAPLFAPPTQHFTIIFNTFVYLTLFNEINSRKVHGERNVFKGLLNNHLFCVIWTFTFIAQFFIIHFGGQWFSTAPLNGVQWGICLALGASSLIWGQIVATIPSKKLPKKFAYGRGEVSASPLTIIPGFAPGNCSLIPNLRCGRHLWVRGMSLIALQFRVVRAFQRRFNASIGDTAPKTSKKVLEEWRQTHKKHRHQKRSRRAVVPVDVKF